MAKTRFIKSYTTKYTESVVQVGDDVLIRPSKPDEPSYVARVESLKENPSNSKVTVKVRWYYRPEDTIASRCDFHGTNELFLSDHIDTLSAETIEQTCIISTLENHTKTQLGHGDTQFFFCRFQYLAATGEFLPDHVQVYCKCNQPFNPDKFMVQCQVCLDCFHPGYLKMTDEDAKKIKLFYCPECISNDNVDGESDKPVQGSQADYEVALNPKS